MTIRTSIIELHELAITLRAEEAVAIIQQLIHTLPDHNDVSTEQPFGPPSLQNVYLDDEGLVTCRACQATPAVAEMAILLQRLLPPGTPKVPGALRYVIARALHEVDAPPFDSIQDFSAALQRFEAGDRPAVVRALAARATVVGLDRLRGRSGQDRRRLIPSSTDFRRELRAADARYYELASAAGHVVVGPKAVPEQRRSPTLVAGILAGVCLVCVGEVMHTRSATVSVAPSAPAVRQQQEMPTETTEPDAVPGQEQDAVVPVPIHITKVVAPVATASGVENPSKSTVKRALRRPPPPAPRARRVKNEKGIMDRLHLGWLRNAVSIRHDPL